MEEKFIIGKSYTFKVVYMQANAYGSNYIYLQYGARDTFRVKAYPFQIEDPDNLPQEIDCIVTNIDIMTGLPTLRQDRGSLLKKLYFVGEEYPFKVTDILIDANTNAPYYFLTDTFGLEHRFYFTGEPKHQKSDIFSMKIEKIDEERGLLGLSELEEAKTDQLAEIDQPEVETTVFGTENIHMEFKTSIVFVPGSSTPDIDKQLLKIVRTIAGFMNASGGTLWIGVNDLGNVTGIEPDFAYLNSGDDEFNGSYKSTPDGYELKIRNNLSRICSNAAGSRLNFRFLSNSAGKIYCGIDIDRSNTPVFVNGTFLFQRAGNQVQQLKGDDITNFIRERYLDELKGILSEYIRPEPKLVDNPVPGNREIPVAAPILPRSPIANDEVYNHFTFYKDGKWSFQKNVINTAIVEYELPVLKSEKDYPMLMCYDNGCINVVIPSKIRSGKDRGKIYSNGWNTEAKIMAVFVSPPYNLIAAFSCDHEGINRVKAHSITDFNTVESIKGKGATIANSRLGRIIKYKLVEVENKVAIPNLIMEKRFTSQSLGFRLTDPAYRTEVEFLENL